jgi:hypothetical protein
MRDILLLDRREQMQSLRRSQISEDFASAPGQAIRLSDGETNASQMFLAIVPLIVLVLELVLVLDLTVAAKSGL